MKNKKTILSLIGFAILALSITVTSLEGGLKPEKVQAAHSCIVHQVLNGYRTAEPAGYCKYSPGECTPYSYPYYAGNITGCVTWPDYGVTCEYDHCWPQGICYERLGNACWGSDPLAPIPEAPDSL
jgi:hypothetical protein